MPGEWHGAADSVMPVWHDVHRTLDAAFLADETSADRRPGQFLGQGVQPDISIRRSQTLEHWMLQVT
jgi:hypothetical protein